MVLHPAMTNRVAAGYDGMIGHKHFARFMKGTRP
jgi:hypothetical protein